MSTILVANGSFLHDDVIQNNPIPHPHSMDFMSTVTLLFKGDFQYVNNTVSIIYDPHQGPGYGWYVMYQVMALSILQQHKFYSFEWLCDIYMLFVNRLI